MKRSLFLVFLAVTAWQEVSAAGLGLAPAPYKALPVGTVLDYGKWECTVTSSSGIETVCRGGDGSKVSFLGKFVPSGALPRSGYGTRLTGVSCGRIYETPVGARKNIEEIDSVEIDARARKAIGELWPLQAGKSVTFFKTFHPGRRRATARIRVEGTRSVSVGGARRDVYVVRGETRKIRCSEIDGPEYRAYKEVWYYDPESATVIYYEYEWLDPGIGDEFFDYRLVSLRMPDGQAPAVPSAPSASAPIAPDTGAAPAPEPEPETASAAPPPDDPPWDDLKKVSTGTGFFITAKGHVLTNRHVVANCTELRIAGARSVRKVAAGGKIDLAVLAADMVPRGIAQFRGGRSVRIGEDIIVAGYPLHGFLSSGLTVTTGIVSSTRGPSDNQDMIQITAPVQLGNSGGPVLDSSGHVVGVVFSKLNALRFARITGSIPQNINFAVSGGSTRAFLDGYSIPYDTAPSAKPMHTADIAEKAQDYTVVVECWR